MSLKLQSRIIISRKKLGQQIIACVKLVSSFQNLKLKDWKFLEQNNRNPKQPGPLFKVLHFEIEEAG